MLQAVPQSGHLRAAAPIDHHQPESTVAVMPSSTVLPAWKRHLAEWSALGMGVALLAAAGLLWQRGEAERMLSAEQDRIDVFANLVANDISVSLVAVNQALAGIVRDRLPDPDRVDVEAVNRRMTALSEAMPSVRGMTFIGVDGKVVSGVPADLIGRDFSQRDYFTTPRRLVDPATFYLAPPFRSIRGDIVVTASRMVPGRDGAFRGIVSATLSPRYFTGMLRSVLYAPDVRAAVAGSGGQPFIEVGAALPAAAAADGSGPAVLGGRAPLLAQRKIQPANVGIDGFLTVTISRDGNAVVAPLNRQFAMLAALLALFAAAAALLLAWSQRRRRRQHQLDAERRRERNLDNALRDSEARFRTLIEEAPVAVAMLRAGRFVYTNRRYNLLHGHPAGESMAGMPWRAMIAPASLQRLGEQEALIAADSPAEQHFEAVGLRRDGSSIPVFKATTWVELADGPATLIFAQDISKQKRAEAFLLEARDAAEAASRSKAEFLANMSHEIRTPLNAILGLAYLLEQAELGADAQAMLLKIRASGRSLLGIINDVLDVSKIEAGAMTLDRSWFALQDVIDNVAATMGVAVADKDIELLVQPLPRQVGSIMGDALRLEQLLVNLTSNAIKFTASGRVELAVLAAPPQQQQQQQQGDNVDLTFEVRDTGIGIDPAQQQAIFAPFTQADTSTTRRFGGTGLGLTICKQLVALMKGRIGVRSAPGEGSVFWFTIPVPCMPATHASNAYSSPDMLDLQVLAVADSAPALDNAALVARSLGWRVDTLAIPAASAATAADGAGAGAGVVENAPAHTVQRRRLDGTLPGVILLDCHDDGAAVANARAIRVALAGAACPLVVLSSTYAVAALNAGASADAGLAGDHGAIDAVLTKPLTASTLYNAVIEARRKRASAASGAAARSGGRQLAGLRLLVVDDSEINREVARRILSDQGASVALAGDGSAALDWLNEHPDEVDLVLMDVQMPVMDGIEATRQLRTMARFDRLPIVALTAGAFQSHHDAARAAGMSHFITKPFDIPLTIALIRRLTGLQEREEAATAAAAAAAAGCHGSPADDGNRPDSHAATLARPPTFPT